MAASKNLSGYDFHVVSAASRCSIAAPPRMHLFEPAAFGLRSDPSIIVRVNHQTAIAHEQHSTRKTRRLPGAYGKYL